MLQIGNLIQVIIILISLVIIKLRVCDLMPRLF